jgi:hypothetical protein
MHQKSPPHRIWNQPYSWKSVSPAGEQIARADRFQRGGTWAFFMLGVLLPRVLSFWAAAHLRRWPVLSMPYWCSFICPRNTVYALCLKQKITLVIGLTLLYKVIIKTMPEHLLYDDTYGR